MCGSRAAANPTSSRRSKLGLPCVRDVLPRVSRIRDRGRTQTNRIAGMGERTRPGGRASFHCSRSTVGAALSFESRDQRRLHLLERCGPLPDPRAIRRPCEAAPLSALSFRADPGWRPLARGHAFFLPLFGGEQRPVGEGASTRSHPICRGASKAGARTRRPRAGSEARARPVDRLG